MEQEKKQLKPYQGILVFIIVILMLLFVAAPIQLKWGMYGVVLTELLILLCGIIPAILFKADLRVVLPIRIPSLRQIVGVAVMWLGSFTLVALVTLIIGFFFQEGLSEVSNALQEVFTSIPMGIAFLIIAVSPAICEEVLVRGFVLSAFSSLKNKWMIAFIVGILFGIFHLDPYRFLPTAILGMVLSYIMIETKNILLPALFHFINNGFSTITSFVTPLPQEGAAVSLNVTLELIGAYLIFTAGAPFLLLWGSKLLHKREQGMDEEAIDFRQKQNRKLLWITVACSVFLVVAGLLITVTTIR